MPDRIIGILLAIGFLTCFAPLFRIKRSRRIKVVSLRRLPEVATYADGLSRDLKLPRVGKIIILGQSYGTCILMARSGTLVIGLPLLMTLDPETFAAGLIRELVHIRHQQRRRLGLLFWVDSVFTAMHGALSVSPSPLPTRQYQCNIYVYITQLIMKPLALIPYDLHKLMETRFVLMEQLAIYRSNQETLRYVSKQSLMNYLSVLGLRDPVTFDLSRILDYLPWDQQVEAVQRKLQSRPPREVDRCFRTATETWSSRPRPVWQAQVLQHHIDSGKDNGGT